MIRMIGVSGRFFRLSIVVWNHSMTLLRCTSEVASAALCGSSMMIAPPKPSRILPAP